MHLSRSTYPPTYLPTYLPVYLGNLFKAQGRLEDAKRYYLEAIRVKPDFAIAWSNLAGVFKEEGQLPTAISYCK